MKSNSKQWKCNEKQWKSMNVQWKAMKSNENQCKHNENQWNCNEKQVKTIKSPAAPLGARAVADHLNRRILFFFEKKILLLHRPPFSVFSIFLTLLEWKHRFSEKRCQNSSPSSQKSPDTPPPWNPPWAAPGADTSLLRSQMPSEASSLLSAKLRCYFLRLPSHFGTDFWGFSALPGHQNHAFRLTGSTFLRFSQFSLHIASSPSLRACFGRFSGPLGTSWRAPGPTFRGQNFPPRPKRGDWEIRRPPFWRTCVQVRLRPPKWCPRSPQNDPKTSPNPPQNAPQRPQIRCPPSYFSYSFRLPASQLLSPT